MILSAVNLVITIRKSKNHPNFKPVLSTQILKTTRNIFWIHLLESQVPANVQLKKYIQIFFLMLDICFFFCFINVPMKYLNIYPEFNQWINVDIGNTSQLSLDISHTIVIHKNYVASASVPGTWSIYPALSCIKSSETFPNSLQWNC